ncbi:hypothetical protein TDB9533_01895 [Thalassocella blandensis]|nr:hypothetical protein TDB9533_01895 [Thalassocella blandensis]
MKRHTLLISTLLISLFGIPSYAEAPVWKVSKNGHHVYLGGTFHMLAKSDYPLPKAFEKAYKDASTLLFETDIQALQSPKYQMQLMNAMTLRDGSTIKDKLSPKTFAKLQAFFDERNIPAATFNYLTPTGVALTIAVMEYQRLGMNPESGVDQYYSNKAKADGKSLDQLNTPEEQISFIANLGKGQEDEMIMQTLSDIELLSSMLGDLKAAWRTGDLTTLNKDYLAPIQKEFPDAYQELFVDRNNSWLPKVLELLKDEDTEFVLVGAVHMAGEEGLIEQLKRSGCKIEQMQ